jgi:uncharacterized protein YoxC
MSPTNSDIVRRVQNLEAQTAGLTAQTSALTQNLSLVSAKTDTILVELRSLTSALNTHAKEAAAVALRVHDLERASLEASARAAESATKGQNVKAALWLAVFTVAGDVVLQLLTHLHLIH